MDPMWGRTHFGLSELPISGSIYLDHATAAARAAAMRIEEADDGQGAVHVRKHLRDRFLLLLACAAGGIDALGLIGLGGVFASALSGNTVLLGIALVQGRLEEAVLCSTVFLGFVPGTVAGALLLRPVPKNAPWTGRITAAITIEAAALLLLVLGFFIIGDAEDVLSLAPLVALSAFAMGLQYATIVRLNVHGVSTTFVTSTLVNLVWRLTVPERAGKEAELRNHEEERGLSERTNLFLGSIWAAYFAGALASAALTFVGRTAAALLPLLLVGGIVVYIALSRPGKRGERIARNP